MEEVIIKGKPCPVHFGLRAISRYGQKHGIDFAELISTPELFSSFEGFAEIGAMGLNDGARKARLGVRYTEEQMWDIFDDEPRVLLDIIQIFMRNVFPKLEELGNLTNNPNAPSPTR
jgi:hypothetical protein